jgi:Bacterial SH3 domain
LYREPSLSSLVAGYSSPGTVVQILEYNNGWFRVRDPASEKSGWAYYKSLEYIHGPNAAPAQVAAVDEPAVKPASNAVSTTSRKPDRIAQPAVKVSDDREIVEPRDFRSAERAGKRKVAETGKRRRGFGLFKRRQERKAWALGPSN